MEIKKFDPDKFNKFLMEQAKIIKEHAFDASQIVRIIQNIRPSIDIWRMHGNSPVIDSNLMAESLFEFNLALEIAYSNYRKENKNMWTAIFGWGKSKVPQLDVNKILSKR